MQTEVLSAVQANVAAALREDVGAGDLTAGLIDPARQAQAQVLCRDNAVICGRPWVEETLRQAAPNVRMQWLLQEDANGGAPCAAGQVFMRMSGPARELLTAERTALNFVQLLSAVATKTATYVKTIEGTKARIVDTRKTLPGLRVAQKYAVVAGGGLNHRMGLHDAILIKENHIAAAGGVAEVLALIQATPGSERAKFVEIEVETLAQLQEALAHGAKMLLLDNMDLPTLHEAVRINAGRAVLEISGGVNLQTVRDLALTGVDRISIGALTKDVTAVDLSMRFQDQPV
jgi:nicotinate-nucleotide pyrophosphorylase (carboxylating)